MGLPQACVTALLTVTTITLFDVLGMGNNYSAVKC